MTGPILITGATGKLGRLVIQRLIDLRLQVRVLTRNPEVAARLFGSRVEIATGDFGDAASLGKAVAGIERLFLLSPISEHLAAHQIAVAEAAVAAGVQRIVKVSGSDWTIAYPGQSISGDAHANVEWRLRALPVEHVALRPTAWMQVSLGNLLRPIEARQPVASAYGNAGVGFIDAGDIADVAVQQLLADSVARKPLVLTGPEVLQFDALISKISALLGRQVETAPHKPTVVQLHANSFEHRAVGEFMVLIANGAAGYVNTTVEHILGRPPRSVDAFLQDHFAATTALAG